MPTLIDKISAKGFTPEQPLMQRETISVKEKGKKYTLTLNPKKECVAYQIDGVILKDGNRCDKLIVARYADHTEAAVFVELKGRNISHAIDQLEATLKQNVFKHRNVAKRKACIVGQSIPRNTGNSVVEKAKIRFNKTYNCQLRAFSSSSNDTL